MRESTRQVSEDHGQRKRWASCAVPSPGDARCLSRLVISLAPPKEHGSKTACGPSRRRIDSMPGRPPHSRPPGHESVTRPAAPGLVKPKPNGTGYMLQMGDTVFCTIYTSVGRRVPDRNKHLFGAHLFGAREEELTTRRGSTAQEAYVEIDDGEWKVTALRAAGT